MKKFEDFQIEKKDLGKVQGGDFFGIALVVFSAVIIVGGALSRTRDTGSLQIERNGRARYGGASYATSSGGY